MMNTLALLLVALSLPCCTGQSMESIPSSSVVKKPGETLSLSCRGSGFTFSCCGMNWIRQPAGKTLEWMGFVKSDGTATGYASSLQGRVEITRDNSNSMSYLRLSSLKPEDSAVYYCAKQLGSAFDYWGKGTMVTVTSATSTKPTVFPLMQCGSGSGNTVTLGCYATGFTPSSLTYAWTTEGTSLSNSIQYPPVQKGSHYTGISQIQVSKQDWDARKIFQCAVTHAAGNGQASFQKPVPPQVTYQLPTLSVSVSSDDEKKEASISCFAKDFSPKDHKLTWMQDDKDITDKIYEITTPVQERTDANGSVWYSAASFLSVSSVDLTPTTEFTCLFEGKGEGDTKTYVNESMALGPLCPGPGDCIGADADITIIGPTNEDMFMTRKGKIVCQVQENMPSVTRIWWEDDYGNKLVEYSKSTDNGKKKIDLALDITYDEWNQGIKRFCVVEHSEWLDTVMKLYERSIAPGTCVGTDADITIIGPTNEDMFMTRKGKIVCQVQENKPSVSRIWWEDNYGNKLVESSKSTDNGKKIMSLALNITYDEWNQGIKRFCVVEHSEWLEPVKKLYERSIGGQTQRPSVFMMPPVEHTRKEMVTLTCFVKDFFPQEVYVSWLVDDEEVDSTYEFHTTNPVESYGSYSAYSQLLLTLEQWKRNDVVYSCVVHHESVANTTKAIVRSIGYRTHEKNTNLVNLNMNVPDTCKPQ